MRVGAQGRIVIPAEIRRELGIEPGDELIPRVERGRLVLDSQKSAIDRLEALFAEIGKGRDLVEELLEERREDLRLSAEKWKRLGHE